MKAKKLPEKCYLKWSDGEDDTLKPSEYWLVASETPTEFAEKDETVEVGEYKLVRKVKVINETTDTTTVK